jgi:hypothetical protein
MFRDIVSNLSLSPAANSQLVFYFKRLRQEQFTRQLSLVMAGMLVLVQLATMIAPADASNNASPNDIIYGGIQSNPKADLLQVYDQNHDTYGHTDFQALYAHYGLTRADLADATPGTISSSDHTLLSLGRENRFPGQEQVFSVGSYAYYNKPLYLWGDGITYDVLIGHRHSDGAWFAIMYKCGNIVVHQGFPAPPEIGSYGPQTGHTPPTVPKVPIPKQPTPKPTIPTPAPTTVTGSNTPATPPSLPGSPILSKSAVITPADGGPTRNASAGQPVGAGDAITYTLMTTDPNSSALKNYAVSDDISDILEYANVTDQGDGTVTNGTISWDPATIQPHQTDTTTFTVTVMDPIPTTPASTSDPQSYDFKIDNVYGNLVEIPVAVPAAAQIAVASQQLPQTGAGVDGLIVALLAAAIGYFYMRNRQLVSEVEILRGDHYGPGGMQ